MISVIVPVYNVEKYLRKCVDSIIYQTYKELEIILVDDGSPDNCPAICDDYARMDNRIRVIHQENSGLSAARNAGIDIATGDYIAFVDSDDYLMPNMYERLLSEMQSADADIVMCSYLNINDSGCYLEKARINEWIGSGIEFLRTDGVVYNYAWNKLYRRELFDEIRFPVGKYFEDIFVMHDIFMKANKVSLISNPLYIYQQRDGGISVNLVSPHRVDYIEALVRRIETLIEINAEENVIFYYTMQFFNAWKRFYLAGMLKNPVIGECWNKYFAEFQLITKGIAKNWKLSHKLKLSLFRVNPLLLRYFLVSYGIVRKVASKCKRLLLNLNKSFRARKYFHCNGYEAEQNKYKSAYLKESSNLSSLIIKRMEAFNSSDLVLKSDNLSLSDDPCVPTVIVVVKNEIERIKLFFEHYRKLGVHQFVILDNNSSDGTLEFLLEQPNTRVYQTCEEFQTQRKEGWIEKILAMTGYNRWYIVVDSDELLDYIGSEEHSVENFIRKVHANGTRRICGYMLDMYSRETLFNSNCEVSDIVRQYRYFDKEGYYTKGYRQYSDNYILGGPRMRVFGTYLVLSKQAIFYFDEQTLYRDCHSLFPSIPVSQMPTLFVLRHYKFLNRDYEEYQRRIREKNFYNNSIEYRTIIDQIHKNGDISLYYHKSCEYFNSDSLRDLPYLDEVTW